MARITSPRYYIRVDTYWQNSPDRFVGPFETREEAQKALSTVPESANVWLSTSTCGGNIRTAIRVYPAILTATEAKRSGMIDDYGHAHRNYNIIPAIPRDTNELFDLEQRGA